MADSILFGIAQKIIENIASAAVQEIVSIWGAKKELSGLEKTISRIRDVLLDAEEQQDHNNQVRSWLKELEDAVYEADDLMDDVYTEALRRKLTPGSNMMKEVRTFFSSSNQLLFRCNMAHKIKDINDRLAAISENRRNFQLEVRREETRAREQTHSYIPEKEVIGRESDRKAILDLLLDPKVEENVSVLPIVGLGGLGKTTLAQFVFNHEKVQTNFDLKMWVCVSENFDLKSLVERIIKSASNQSLGNLEMDQLQKQLQKEINGKRYFLVLDDVWSENREEWRKLKNLLSNGANGSRIMITTRSQVVGEITTTCTMKPYMLEILDKDDSWSLFKNVAFKLGQEPKNPNTKKTAMEIVEKCGGIPLAIRTIGSMLYSKYPETEWSSFLEIEFSRIPQTKNDILPTLKLSYDNLPSHLKYCFAYCSLFPKDHKIEVDMVIKLWMAQGFIKPSISVQSLEEVGYGHFKDLLWRSFFQEEEKNDFGDIIFCKMHDLMHDLAIQVAGTECATLHSVGENIEGRPRHVSFDFSLDPLDRFPKFLSKENRIRTILLPQQSLHSNNLSRDVVLGLKVLRTLDLSRSRLKTVPNSIGKLKHLRYLDLSDNKRIKTLPNSITKLLNLQTLKLSGCWDLVELPRDLKKLVNLRHLDNYQCYSLTHMPCGLGNLTNLQTLREFVLEAGIGSTGTKRPHNGHEFSGGLKELMELNNLRGELFIKNLRHGEDASVEYKDAKLNEKQHLHHLQLEWCINATTEAADYEITLESLQPHPNLKSLYISAYRGVRLASWFSSLTTLDTLVLERCEEIKNVLPLSQLRCLKSLRLFGLDSLEYISDSNVKSDLLASPTTVPLLSTLESLELEGLPKLKGWWKDDLGEKEEEDDDASNCTCEEEEEDIPPFQCLSNLKIKSCPKLTSNMPLYPYLEGELELTDNNNLKTFQRTQQMKMKNSFSPLSKLTSVYIRRIESLESLPEELISLTSLKDLSIRECPKLKYLSPAIQHLTSLQQLRISSCDEADIYDSDGNMWQALDQSLRHLRFENLPQLETLPDGLQQLTSLQQLILEECKSLVGIPEWIGKLKSLQKLSICGELETLPAGLQQLTSLQQLELKECKSLVGIPEWIGNLKSLQQLHIHRSNKLTSLPEGMGRLTSLQELHIRGCPFYNGDGNMWQGLDQSLRELCFEDLPQLETLPAGLQQLTSLQELELKECKSLVGIPEWIGNLKSLQQLNIDGCDKLTSLPEGMRQLTSLQVLWICNCPIYNGDGNMWQGLKSLRFLWFHDLPQLETLPAGLQQLTALQFLYLSSCKSLVGIPEWIGNLKSLQQLDINECDKLTSLPEGMRQLTSLQSLRICDCPILKQRYERETGEDWHKVAHIPDLYIYSPHQPSTSSSARGKIFKCFRRLKLCNK